MPIGPNGEKRPADPVASANLVARIVTGLAEEQYVDASKSEAGRKGGKSRAAKLSAEQRRKIAMQGVAARRANGETE